MKVLFRLAIYLLSVLALLALLAWLAARWTSGLVFDEQPLLTEFQRASLEDMQRIKSLAIQASAQNGAGGSRSLELSERDINLGISHFGPTQVRIPKSTFAAVDLHDGEAEIQLTLPAALIFDEAAKLPELQDDSARAILQWVEEQGREQWINASWRVAVNPDQPKEQWLQPGQLRIGELTLSQSLSEQIAARAYEYFKSQRQSAIVLESWKNITGLKIHDGELLIDFNLPDSNQALASYQSLVLTPDQQTSIAHYSALLATLPQKGRLVHAIAPLFTEATTRANQSLDPVGENRAALLALSRHYGGDKLLMMLNDGQRPGRTNTPTPYTLYQRKDLAQHYVLSAGLALIADQNIAELIGLDKEISDLVGGSTISAWDLLADKAGVRLAENATLSAKTAREVQLALSHARKDSQLLPDLALEFEFSNDRFEASELAELEVLIELYLEAHPLLQKRS